MFIFPGLKICSEPQAASLLLSDHKFSLMFTGDVQLVIAVYHWHQNLNVLLGKLSFKSFSPTEDQYVALFLVLKQNLVFFSLLIWMGFQSIWVSICHWVAVSLLYLLRIYLWILIIFLFGGIVHHGHNISLTSGRCCTYSCLWLNCYYIVEFLSYVCRFIFYFLCSVNI